MGQRQSATIFMDEDEGWATHSCRWGSQACGNSTNQRGFSRSQLAEERERFPSLQCQADGAAESIGMQG